MSLKPNIKTTLSSVDFIKELNNSKAKISDKSIEERITIKQQEYKCDSLFIIDVHFKDDVYLSRCDINNGIKFVNCEFDRFFVFDSCYSRNRNYDFLRGDLSVEFINCKINFQLDVRFCKLEGGFAFNNCQLSKVDFQQIHINSTGGIEFTDGTNINSSLFISNCNFAKGRFAFLESTMVGPIRFEHNAIGSYSFSFSKFIKNIFIWSGYCNDITFYDSHFEDDFNIQVVKTSKSISIIQCHFKKIFRIELDEANDSKKGFINSLYISNSNFKDAFKLLQYKEHKLPINELNLVFANLNGSFHIDDVIINELNLSGFNKESRLVLDNVILNNLSIQKFRNTGNIDFINVRPANELSIFKVVSSILGAFSFINCNLDNYTEIVIKDSELDEVISSGTKWFDFKKLIKTPVNKNRCERIISNLKMLVMKIPNSDLEVQKLFQIREIFRQLKSSMNKQGNAIQGLFFKSQEYEAYQRELKLTHHILKPERLILEANRSNNQGRHWLKPIGLAIIFTSVLFVLMVFSMNPLLGIHWPWETDFEKTLQIYSDYIRGMPNLINPTFRLNLVFPEHAVEFTFWTYFWSMIQRVCISYLIFQVVSAFRKYFK